MLHSCGRSASILLPRVTVYSTARIPTLRSLALARPTSPLSQPGTSHPGLFHRSFRSFRSLRRPRKSEKEPQSTAVSPGTSNAIPTTQSTEPRLYERLYKAGMISSLQVPPKMSNLERLWRPFLFTVIVGGGALFYGYNWKPPKPEDRWFPTVPVAFATVAPIIAINTAVFLIWKIPLPATWRLLNRYFITVPALPYAASMLGSVFSHQTSSHLALNMLALYMFGTSLCEQIGSGWFVALYMSGGVVSSFASMAIRVLQGNLMVTSLGASGAITAVLGTYAYLNPDRELYLIFLPFLAFKAKTMVTCFAAFEMLGIFRGWRTMDHVAHLGGLAWGLGFVKWLEGEVERRKAEYRKRLEERGFR